MGHCLSLSNMKQEPLQSKINILNDIYREMASMKKILILGAGRSGKSTIFRQLRIICGEAAMREQAQTQRRREYIRYIQQQCICQMKLALDLLLDFSDDKVWGHQQLMRNCKEYNCLPHDDLMNLVFGYIREFEEECSNDVCPLRVPMDVQSRVFHQCASWWMPYIPDLSEQGMEAADIIQSLHHTRLRLTDEVVAAIKILWDEPAIQKMYEMRNITGLSDSTAYFWNNLEVIVNRNYIPDSADMLLVRKRTIVGHEFECEVKNSDATSSETFRIVDVGGPKSQRRRWICWMESVSAVFFVASLSCYDHVLFEDNSTNAMTDQLELFDDVVNNENLMKSSMILFLNKKDLFAAKIQRVPLTVCKSFSSYRGKRDSVEEATKYIQTSFTSLNERSRQRHIFTHVTCALNIDRIQSVFSEVQKILIECKNDFSFY